MGKIPGIRFGAGQLSIPALLQFWSISDLISDLTRQLSHKPPVEREKGSEIQHCSSTSNSPHAEKGTKGGEAPELLPFTLNHLLHHSLNSYQAENHLKK